MRQETVNHGRFNSKDFRASVPMQVAPGIKRVYHHLGQRLYETLDGRDYDANTYDRVFNVKKGKVIPKTKKRSVLRKNR